jgi:hypothetical protein
LEEGDKVISFKPDFFVVDQIAFKFLWKDGASLVVTEEMSRWKELLQTLPKRLPGLPAEREWFKKSLSHLLQRTIPFFTNEPHAPE